VGFLPNQAFDPLHANHIRHGAIRAYALNIEEDGKHNETSNEKAHSALLPPSDAGISELTESRKF
jgi:hypothetical protein